MRGSLQPAWEHDPHDTIIHKTSSEDKQQQHVSDGLHDTRSLAAVTPGTPRTGAGRKVRGESCQCNR